MQQIWTQTRKFSHEPVPACGGSSPMDQGGRAGRSHSYGPFSDRPPPFPSGRRPCFGHGARGWTKPCEPFEVRGLNEERNRYPRFSAKPSRSSLRALPPTMLSSSGSRLILSRYTSAASRLGRAILSVVERCCRFQIPVRRFFSVPKEKMLSTPAPSHFENSRHHITAGLILPPMSP